MFPWDTCTNNAVSFYETVSLEGVDKAGQFNGMEWDSSYDSEVSVTP